MAGFNEWLGRRENLSERGTKSRFPAVWRAGIYEAIGDKIIGRGDELSSLLLIMSYYY